jgi:hypothetical protein
LDTVGVAPDADATKRLDAADSSYTRTPKVSTAWPEELVISQESGLTDTKESGGERADIGRKALPANEYGR